jgi:hypothetical protein
MARPAQGFEFRFFGLVFFCAQDHLIEMVPTCEFGMFSPRRASGSDWTKRRSKSRSESNINSNS